MGVSVDQGGRLRVAQQCQRGVRIDIDEMTWGARLAATAVSTQGSADPAPNRQRQGGEDALRGRPVHEAAIALVGDVVDAQRVAVRQHDALPECRDQCRIGQA